MNHLSQIEKQLLHLIQTDFPLTPRPYQTLGDAIGKTEAEVIAMVQALKERNILRQISAIFNSALLGFASALVSFQIPENQLEHAAQIINAHPGVSHNYLREHRFNLWFTLAVPEDLDITRHVRILAALTACAKDLYLPSRRMFKRQVQFDLTEQANTPDSSSPSSSLKSLESPPEMSSKIMLAPEVQGALMNELQQDLPLSPTPFHEIAQRCQVQEKTVFAFLTYLQDSRKMSRFAGIVKHRQLGFTANAMVVWQVPEHLILPFAECAVTYRAISHCYERVTYPEWPYNLYTMIHGVAPEATQRVIAELAAQFELRQYEILPSRQEYKKQRVNYFNQEIYAWDQQHHI